MCSVIAQPMNIHTHVNSVQAWETILEVLGMKGTAPCVYTHGTTPASLKELIPKAPGVRIQRDVVACRYQVFHLAALAVGEEFLTKLVCIVRASSAR